MSYMYPLKVIMGFDQIMKLVDTLKKIYIEIPINLLQVIKDDFYGF
jgi:hypothetical protein